MMEAAAQGLRAFMVGGRGKGHLS